MPATLPQVRLHNSLTRRTEPLEPLEPGRVTVYTCGSTVYKYAHIGNLRTYLFGDLLHRTLEYLGYEVRYVKNITDVGHMRDDQLDSLSGPDKIELAAETEGKSPDEIAEFYTRAWLEDEALINILPVDVMPRATDHIPEMIEMTAQLLDEGPRLRSGRHHLLRRERVRRLRQALGAEGRGDARGPSRRGRVRQARSRRLRALEARARASVHEVAVTVGRWISRAGTSSARR